MYVALVVAWPMPFCNAVRKAHLHGSLAQSQAEECGFEQLQLSWSGGCVSLPTSERWRFATMVVLSPRR